jgi:cyclopropane fatty-acyl-phospholipid synthase-like methyltransferase
MDQRQLSPSTARNREPILAVLRRVIPAGSRVLEIASGTGEHAMFFASQLPGVHWQPSDPDPTARASTAAWTEATAEVPVEPPLDLDVMQTEWWSRVAGPFDAIVAVNMIHISPWEATLGLMAGAGRLLGAGGVLFTYGPYMRDGHHTAPSNAAFDGWLKERDGRFGVRDLADVEAAAKAEGLALREVVAMPANNFSLVFERMR